MSFLTGKRIGILGFGNFGQFLAERMVKTGCTVVAHSRTNYSKLAGDMGVIWESSLGHFLQDIEILIISTSILSFETIVKKIAPFLHNPILVADVLSVKTHAKKTLLQYMPEYVDIVCTHPMFGPESGKNQWETLPFVYEPVKIRDYDTMNEFISWWTAQGCKTIQMACEIHDEYASGSQFVAHFVGRVLGQLGLKSTPINTNGYCSLLELVENTQKDSFDLFSALYKFNPTSESQLKTIESAVKQVANQLRGTGFGTVNT